MTIVSPATYTIKSTNVPLSDHTEYNSETTYNKGDKCTVLADKKNYYCVENGTKGKEPKTNCKSGDVWVDEPMNAYALFDLETSKQTKNQDLIEFVIKTDEADTFVLLDVEASEVSFEYTKNNQVIFSETKQMIEFELNSLYDYFFPKYKANKIAISQPNKIIYFGVEVKVSIKYPSNTAKAGFLFVGKSNHLGLTLVDGKVRYRRFGKMKRDVWGNLKKENSNIYSTIEAPIFIYNHELHGVHKTLLENKNELCIYLIDNEGYSDMTTLFGTFDDLEFPLTNTITQYTLRLEEAYANIKD